MQTVPKKQVRKAGAAKNPVRYPLEFSIGAAIRHTHRSFTQRLESHLAQYGVVLGSWYFLRVLWEEDGLTQHELSVRVGIVDPTTVQQLRSMEAAGLVIRHRSDSDRRKIHVFLTESGRDLRDELEPFVHTVNSLALGGLTEGEIGFLRLVLSRIRQNLDDTVTAPDALAPDQSRRKPARSSRK